MEIFKHLNKDNLHHAYLIEGAKEEIVPELLNFIQELGVKTSGNPDFSHIIVDSFKIDDARNLKGVEYEKGFSESKKIFLITANNFLLEAQNTLLKIFEEPIENTHFFLVVPNKNILLETLLSRFYIISIKQDLVEELNEAEKFIKMQKKGRIDFIKEFLLEEEKIKCINFLNALEILLHNKFVMNFSGLTLPGVPGGTHTVQNSLQICFEHIFKVRQFLNQPGSSAKTLMESVALIIPNF